MSDDDDELSFGTESTPETGERQEQQSPRSATEPAPLTCAISICRPFILPAISLSADTVLRVLPEFVGRTATMDYLGYVCGGVHSGFAARFAGIMDSIADHAVKSQASPGDCDVGVSRPSQQGPRGTSPHQAINEVQARRKGHQEDQMHRILLLPR